MNLLKKIEEAEKGLQNHTKIAKRYKETLENLKNCEQPTNKELYDNMNRYMTYQVITGKYQHILGGDGRSRPWDETRTGEIGEVQLNKGFFLSEEQERIVFGYVKSQYTINYISMVESFTEKGITECG